MITLVVKGDPVVFNSPLTSQFYIEIEHLTTIHFLDTVKFDTVRSMMREGVAYNIFSDPSTGRLELQLAQRVWDACTGGSGGDFSCAVRQDIAKTVIKNPYAVHSMATGIGTTDSTLSKVYPFYFPSLYISLSIKNYN